MAQLRAEHLADLKAKEHQQKLAYLYERLALYAEERVKS